MGEANKIKVYSNLGRVIKDQIRDIMGARKSPEEVASVSKPIQREWCNFEGVYRISQAREIKKKKKNPIQALRDMKDGNTSSR